MRVSRTFKHPTASCSCNLPEARSTKKGRKRSGVPYHANCIFPTCFRRLRCFVQCMRPTSFGYSICFGTSQLNCVVWVLRNACGFRYTPLRGRKSCCLKTPAFAVRMQLRSAGRVISSSERAPLAEQPCIRKCVDVLLIVCNVLFAGIAIMPFDLCASVDFDRGARSKGRQDPRCLPLSHSRPQRRQATATCSFGVVRQQFRGTLPDQWP